MSNFTIKQIFIDNWDNFVIVVILTLAMPYMSVIIAVNFLKYLLDVNLDSVIPAVLSMLKIELLLWLKNLFVVNTDI